WNTGNRNTGDCNTGNWNSGFFNTKENKCFIFDKLSDMTVREFRTSKYYDAIYSSAFILTEWVEYTDDEKCADKAKELIGGHLKRYDYKDACAKWWAEMSAENREIIQQIPNFNADKFFEITGIKV
ncbi:pentapeptide repeat-containing protein, partial [Anaerocaecibacter muris]|uniref:pentapeptide repeat-containing protein n=1 Tax=Anaerocaecibacter muris TaxID=2941513 RepID=UPI003F6936F3